MSIYRGHFEMARLENNENKNNNNNINSNNNSNNNNKAKDWKKNFLVGKF